MESAWPAEAADVERVAALGRELIAELTDSRGGTIWAARESRGEPLDTAYRAVLGDPDQCLVVGAIDAVVVGFAVGRVETLRDGRPLGVVDELFVEAGAREVGVAEAVVEQLIAFFGARECIGADATALPGNRAAKNFFEQHGFVARRIVMHRPLDPAGNPVGERRSSPG